ncbi:MAG: hypothetical protein ACJ76S_02600 [Solirubrobacteraceae bacterium]
MSTAHLVVGLMAIVLFAAAALVGGWRWMRRRPGPGFWPVLRAGQAALVVQAALGGLLLLAGRRTTDLHLVYGLLPLGVSFAAEQLRVSAAQTVLDTRGHDSARAVGGLPEHEQRALVHAIVRRELGVMTVAAAIITALLLRAGFGSGGL